MKPPISDPFAPLSNTSEELWGDRIFRQSFWRVYIGALLLSLIMTPVFCFFSWFSDAQHLLFSTQGIALLLISQMIFLPLILAFAATLHPVKVNASGVQVTVLQGIIKWSQIEKVGRIWMGSSYIRLSIQGRFFKIWLPLTMRDTISFARAVEEWAPEDNPLRLLLQQRGF